MTEEIDLQKCHFRNFRGSVTFTLTLHRVEVKLVRTSGPDLSRHQIRSKSENFLWTEVRTYVRTDTLEFSKSIRISPRRWSKIIECKKRIRKKGKADRRSRRSSVLQYVRTFCHLGFFLYRRTSGPALNKWQRIDRKSFNWVIKVAGG